LTVLKSVDLNTGLTLCIVKLKTCTLSQQMFKDIENSESTKMLIIAYICTAAYRWNVDCYDLRSYYHHTFIFAVFDVSLRS